MGETAFFVPVVESKGALYRLEVIEEGPWMICGVVDGKFKSKILACFENRQTEPTPIAFTLYREGDRAPFMDMLTPNTQSVFLGLFLQAHRYIRRLRFRDGWGSITVTGDLDPHDGRVDLVAVGDIPAKYEGVLAYAKDRPGERHLFVYVGGEALELPDAPGNLEVKAFNRDDSLDDVLLFVFGLTPLEIDKSRLDRTRKPLFRDIIDFRYARAEEEFAVIEKELRQSRNWGGYFVYGQGETGKSAFARAAAALLFNLGMIYAPLWITINNDEAKEKIKDVKAQPGASLVEYFAGKIGRILGIDSEKALVAELNRKKYLIVFDNIELTNNDTAILLRSVQDFFYSLNESPYVIFTSRVNCDDEDLKLALKVKSRGPQEMDSGSLIDLICGRLEALSIDVKRDIIGSNSDDFEELVDNLYSLYGAYPGILLAIISLLKENMTVKQLTEELKRIDMTEDKVQGKIIRAYESVFSYIDTPTQVVLFCILTLGKPDTLLEESVIIERSLLFGNEYGVLHKKEVNNALRALLRSNLIYKELSEDGWRYRYAIKQVPYLAFMFEDSLCGKTDACENLRDNIIAFPYRIAIAIRYYRPSETILELFRKMEAAGGSIPDDLRNGFLVYVARYAQDTAVLEKMLELGCNIDYVDEYGDSAFMTACEDNPGVDVLEWLKNHSAHTAVLKDEDGRCPLHNATLFNPNPRVVQWLLDNGYNPLAEDRFGSTALHYAFFNENLEIFYAYARQPWFNINGKVKNNLSNEIFDEAIGAFDESDFDLEEDHDKIIEETNNLTILSLLRRLNDELNEEEKDKMFDKYIPYIYVSIHNPNIKLFEWFLEHKSRLPRMKLGATLTHLIARVKARPEYLELLVQYKGKKVLRETDDYGQNAFHHAAYINGSRKMYDWLLKNGVEIDAVNADKRTPLMCAAWMNQYTEIIAWFIENDADLYAEDIDGYSVLEYLRERVDWKEIMKCLKTRPDWKTINLALKQKQKNKRKI